MYFSWTKKFFICEAAKGSSCDIQGNTWMFDIYIGFWRNPLPSAKSPIFYEHTHTHTRVSECVCVFENVFVYIYIYIYRVSLEGCARLRESIPYVKIYRYNPKHLYPKLNGYGDNGQRKMRSSCGCTYCTFSADPLCIHCACPWDWNAVNIMPACPCKVLGTLRTTMALMRVFM